MRYYIEYVYSEFAPVYKYDSMGPIPSMMPHANIHFLGISGMLIPPHIVLNYMSLHDSLCVTIIG
jgi:hypothetical protein